MTIKLDYVRLNADSNTLDLSLYPVMWVYKEATNDVSINNANVYLSTIFMIVFTMQVR